MEDRNSLRLFEDERLLFGRDAHHREGATGETAGVADGGLLLGLSERGVVGAHSAAQGQETWPAGEEFVSAWV